MDNEVAMRRAIDLAARARFQAPPNPWVGCVLLRDGEVIAEGATEAPGGRHAEIVALDAAGDAACGATAVVTLEPCSHTGRTGPCADALIAAGVAAVVIAIEDPDPQVAGTGVAALAAAGIPVTTGVEAAAVRAQLRSYLHHRTTGRPSVIWKTGMSLDGRSAARDGSAKWITGDAARHDAQTLRAASQAIIVGSGTAQSDLPALTVRDVPDFNGPLLTRVLLDASGSTPAIGPLFDPRLGPTLVYTSATADAAKWRQVGADVVVVGTSPRGVDLDAVLEDLGARHVLQVLVEGGAQVAGSFLHAGLVDEIVAYVAPRLLGAEALPAAWWPGPGTLADAPLWSLQSARALGSDVRLHYLRST